MYAEFALLAALVSLVGTLPHSDDSLAAHENALNTTTKYTHRTSFLTDPSTIYSTSTSTDVSTHLSMDDSIIRARSHNPVHHQLRPVIHHTPLPENEPGSRVGPHASVHPNIRTGRKPPHISPDISPSDGIEPVQKTKAHTPAPHKVETNHNPPHNGHSAHSPVPTEELSGKKGQEHQKRAAKSPNNAFSVLSSALSSQRHHPHPSDPVRSFRHSQQHHTPKPKVTGSKVHPVPSGHPKSPKSGHGGSRGDLPKFEQKHPPSPITALPEHSSKVTGGQITPIVHPHPTSNPHSSKVSGLNNPFMHPNRPVTNSNQLPKPTPKNTGSGTVGHAKQVKTHSTSTKTQGNGGGFIGKRCTWTPKAKCSAGF